MLEIKQLSAGYENKEVLHQLALTIPAGAVTALLGPNGCGKSTLLKTLCGILPANGGQVLLDGEDLLQLPQQQLARKIAYLAQSRHTPDITAQRLVLHGRFPYLGYPRRYRKADFAAAHAAMEIMGIEDLADRPLQQLSGGQRQKVYIAMALAQDTPVILLDEPITYLDISHQMQMMALARDLTHQGKTVVMVLHDLPQAFSMADNIVLMQAGSIAAQGTAEEVFASGAVDAVFRVKLGRVEAEGSWRYYCVSSQLADLSACAE